MNPLPDINDTVHRMKREGDTFAVATVVRTLSVTAAKPGAKAIINQHGDVVEGWIGGGCARSAVIKAATRSIADGEPRFVSIHPDEVLKEQGLDTGEEIDGRWVASNMCPSKGSMEIFVEPFLANPELIVVGSSPVAESLQQLAALFNFSVSVIGERTTLQVEQTGQTEQLERATDSVKCYDNWQAVPAEHVHRYVVIATQGAGDLKALSAAIGVHARHIGFVGSQRKMAHLKAKLHDQSFDEAALARIKGPAGLDIGAVTPHEIALSILAELVQLRRAGADT